jgi:hypothetical protein
MSQEPTEGAAAEAIAMRNASQESQQMSSFGILKIDRQIITLPAKPLGKSGQPKPRAALPTVEGNHFVQVRAARHHRDKTGIHEKA